MTTLRAPTTNAPRRNLTRNFTCFRVIHLKTLRPKGFQIFHRGLGLQLLLFARGDLILGSDPEHIATLAHTKAFGLQDDVQCLIPRNILQSKCDGTGHGI